MTFYRRSGKFYDRGLVGYWKLDDLKAGPGAVAIDQARFIDGTITGAVLTAGINGLNPDAMQFTTSDSITTSGTVGDMFPGMTIVTPFSISCICKLDADDPGEHSTFFNIFGPGEFDGYAFGHNFERGYYMKVGDSELYEGPNPTGHFDETVSVIFVYDGLNIKTYIDGVLIISQDRGAAPDINTSTVPKIAVAAAFDAAWKGTLQNLRVYNRTLTPGEASKLYRFRL